MMKLLGWIVPTWLVALLAALAGAAAAGWVQQLRIDGADAAHTRALLEAERKASTAKDKLEETRKTLADVVAAIDTRITKERADAAKQTEDRLRGVAAGTVRVRYVAAKCPAASAGGDVPAAAGAASVVDGEGVELSPKAGQDVLLLRQSLSDDAAQIDGLKAYIRVITGTVR